MRKTVGLAAAAVLAATTLGVQVTTTSATGSPATAERASDLGSRAVQELMRHPAAARVATAGPVEQEVEQEFVVTDTITDGDGSTHVRMDRTYGGLPVLGGDLVVHQSASGRWEGASQTLAAPLTLSVRPTVTRAAATAKALSPSKATRSIKHLRAADTEPRLVVDALGGKPRLAFEVLSLGTARRRHPEPAGDVRRRHDRRGAAARGADRHRRRLGPVALQRHGRASRSPSRGRRTSSRTRRAATPPPPTCRTRATPSCARCSASAAATASRSAARTRRSATAPPATVSRPRSTPTTAARRRSTTSRTCTAATASSAPASAPRAGSTTATSTSTRSGTARR